MGLLQMSFYGAVMILAVAVIRTVAADRLPKRTFVVLWSIVLLRLLVPFEISSGFSVYALAGEHMDISALIQSLEKMTGSTNHWPIGIQAG